MHESVESVTREAKAALERWAKEHLPLLDKANDPALVRAKVNQAIDEIARDSTPPGKRNLLDLALFLDDVVLTLSDTPLPGYRIPAVGVIASCFYELLKGRLETHYAARIEPYLNEEYALEPGEYTLLQQNQFGWQILWHYNKGIDAALEQLAGHLLDSTEYYGHKVYQVRKGGITLLQLELTPSGDYPENGEDVEYHVWTSNWNHYAGESFDLARALLVTEVLRALRGLEETVDLGFNHRVSIIIIDQAPAGGRTVWEVTLTIGELINDPEAA
jgi:hypothetical protein